MADEPTPVVVESPTPLPVTIDSPTPLPVTITGDSVRSADTPTGSISQHGTQTTKSFGEPILGERGQSVAAPTSTEEEDRVSLGQRTVNLIWETTQMKVALSVIWASLAVAAMLSVFGNWLGSPDLQLAAVVFLFGVANLVTGFYFGRTNHQKVGGVEQGRQQ